MAENIYKRLNIPDPYSFPTVNAKLKLPNDKAPVQPQKQTERSLGDTALDTYSAFSKGSNALVRTVGDIAALIDGTTEPTYLQKMGQEGMDYWDSKISEAQKEKQRQAQSSIQSQNGEMAQAIEAVKQYAWESPTLLADVVVESIPGMALGGLAGKGAGTAARMMNASKVGATRASIGGAATAESVLQGGQVGGDTMRELKNVVGMSDQEKVDRARMA